MNIYTNSIDLSHSPTSLSYNTDICIIGAGAAGIYAASEFTKANIDVILLEAGDFSSLSSSEMGFDPIFESDTYWGAIKGRFFGIGGTTSNWGGALVPHNQSDISINDKNSIVWSAIVQKVNKNVNYVLNRLGYFKERGFEDFSSEILKKEYSFLKKKGIIIHSNLYIPFSKKNFKGFLEKLGFTPRLRIIYNAVVSDWGFIREENKDVSFKYLIAKSATNKEVKVYAKKFIIAAGAIESARILLEMNCKAEDNLFNKNGTIGCFLSDHLSISIADVCFEERKNIIRLFSPYFEGSWMRGIRFLETNREKNIPRYFTHFIFENNSIGFSILKEILSSIQKRKLPKLSLIIFGKGLVDLFFLVFSKIFYSRLYIHKNTPCHLQLDMEQIGIVDNQIYLDNSTDIFNRKKAKIKWSISDADMEAIKLISINFINCWNNSHESLPKLIPKGIKKEVTKPHDAYHPVGTCRIGTISDGVVDSNLKVWGTSNIWVISTGVLPSAGTANPTLTLLCLAQNLVDDMKLGK